MVGGERDPVRLFEKNTCVYQYVFKKSMRTIAIFSATTTTYLYYIYKHDDFNHYLSRLQTASFFTQTWNFFNLF